MPSRYIFQQSKIPAFGGAWGRKFAKHLWDIKMHYADQRKHHDIMVRECDEMYMCHRYIPDTGAIRLIEDGEFGESDVHDNSNVVSIRLALTLMPRTEQWLRVGGRTGDTDMILQPIEDLQIGLHHKAKTRRNMQKVYKQNYVRGTTWCHYDWEEVIRYRRLTNEENAPIIEKHLKALGMTSKSDRQKFTRGRKKELTKSKPVVKPVDYFDVWVEPLTDIINDERPATIYQTFRPLIKLQAEEDDLGKKLWSNLTDIVEWTLEELYSNHELAGARYGSLRLFGSPTTQIDRGIKLIPIYQCYFPYLKYDDYEFFDTYFYVALDKKGPPRLIRVEENPDDHGLVHLVGDHWVDHYTQQPYGISGVQFQASKYHQKNFLQLLWITSLTHSVFPPNLVLQSAFRDEQELSFNAGDTISVDENALGLEVVKPLNMPYQGAALGQEGIRFLGAELRAQAGVDGLAQDNPARGMAQRKTATEVNADTSSGSFFIDNAAENGTEMLTEVVQGVFQMSQTWLQPDADGYINFEKWEGKRFKQAQLSAAELKKERSIQVLGINGDLNKQQTIKNLGDIINSLATMQDPKAQQLRYLFILKAAKVNNIDVPPEFEVNPQQLVAGDPDVQKNALLDILSNPQKLQALMQDPEIQQALQQLGGMASAQNNSNPIDAAPPAGAPAA